MWLTFTGELRAAEGIIESIRTLDRGWTALGSNARRLTPYLMAKISKPLHPVASDSRFSEREGRAGSGERPRGQITTPIPTRGSQRHSRPCHRYTCVSESTVHASPIRAFLRSPLLLGNSNHVQSSSIILACERHDDINKVTKLPLARAFPSLK